VRISLGFPRDQWTLLWDLTISGWPNEWIDITWQCFIKSDYSQNCMYSITWSLSQRYMYSITWRLLQTASILLHGVWCKNTRYRFPRDQWTLLWDLTISGWPNEWIDITWQCFIKSDSRYLYEYIILWDIWVTNDHHYVPFVLIPDGLSPLEQLGHPRASIWVTLLFSGRQTVELHSNKGDNCVILTKTWLRQ
jgi:hypothetical protein